MKKKKSKKKNTGTHMFKYQMGGRGEKYYVKFRRCHRGDILRKQQNLYKIQIRSFLFQFSYQVFHSHSAHYGYIKADEKRKKLEIMQMRL
jgi:hypothetical protein